MSDRLAWHFSPRNQRLGYGDGRLIVPGETLRHHGPVVPCRSGLHASAHVADALTYAPGPYLWRVRLSGEVVDHAGDTCAIDKMAASERTALWGFDATPVLRDYARRCALDVVHLWDAPPVVREYLRTGDESIRAAAGAAARAAAWDAARAAAWDAARAAARAAAWDAARAAAWDAAWAAAVRRQRARLTGMVWAEARRQGFGYAPPGGAS